MMDNVDMEEVRLSGNSLTHICHRQSQEAGWWTNLETGEPITPDVPEKLCLIHSEVSEALEGYRKDQWDDHLLGRKMFEVELADAIIRIFDLAGAMGITEFGAIIAEKLDYNAGRADHKPENRRKEGGKKF